MQGPTRQISRKSDPQQNATIGRWGNAEIEVSLERLWVPGCQVSGCPEAQSQVAGTCRCIEQLGLESRHIAHTAASMVHAGYHRLTHVLVHVGCRTSL